MRRYVNYLNGIETPEELTEKLKNLKPARSRLPLYIASSAAAVLVLAVGLGVLWRPSPADPVKEHGTPDIGIIGTDATLPGDSHSGWREGYEIDDGEHVSYYNLPWLNIADASGLPIEIADYTLCPLGGYERDLTEEDVVSLFGTDRYREHLGMPEGAALSGEVYFSPQGEASGLILYFAEGDAFRVVYEVLRGYDVPDCIVSPDDDYGVTEVDGVRVTTLAFENYTEVKFYVDGFGYKATLYGEERDELAARFVRLVLASGAGLDGIQ